MKRQFKHTQSSDIVESMGNGYYINIHTKSTLSGKYIENTNDWVEIISKPEYTILSFKFIPNGNIWKLQENGTYNWNNSSHGSVEDFFTRNFYSIHSVRRESDGEIFTVGDNVRLNFNVTSISKLINKIAIEKVGVCPEELFIYTNGEQSTINNYVKVQPKEWEITSLTSPHGPVPVIDSIGFDSLLNNLKGYTIRSIKRLSDNVEFKIDDILVSGCGKQKIIAISIDKYDEKNIWLHYFTEKHSQCTYRLNEVKKVEKLFTTEDGVDIFESDAYTYLDLHSWHIDHGVANKAFNSINIKSAYSKYFSTKEKAEEYILMNKPCLSLNDLNVIGAMTNHNEQKLKELVKTKL